MRQSGTADENTASLEKFLAVPHDTAKEIAETPHLFED